MLIIQRMNYRLYAAWAVTNPWVICTNRTKNWKRTGLPHLTFLHSLMSNDHAVVCDWQSNNKYQKSNTTHIWWRVKDRLYHDPHFSHGIHSCNRSKKKLFLTWKVRNGPHYVKKSHAATKSFTKTSGLQGSDKNLLPEASIMSVINSIMYHLLVI